MNFRRLQHVVLVAWLAVLALSVLTGGRQLLTEYAGRSLTATVTSRTVWNPPYASWPHYNCKLTSQGQTFTVSNTILPWCTLGAATSIKIDPLNPARAQFAGDVTDNGSGLAWYFLGLSLLFMLLGLVLKLSGAKDPWRTAVTWSLDRLQGPSSSSR